MDEQAKQLKAAHQIVIEATGRIVSLYGLPCALGRTYALLYLADAPVNIAEIPLRLGVTNRTAALHIPILECFGLLVNGSTAPGSALCSSLPRANCDEIEQPTECDPHPQPAWWWGRVELGRPLKLIAVCSR